jgi:hypothetical protein
MRRTALALVLAIAALLLTSCKSSNKAVKAPNLSVSQVTQAATSATSPTPAATSVIPTPPPQVPATSAPAPSTPPAASKPAASTPPASPTTLDPCQLVTSSEASDVAGATYAAGKEETTAGGGRLCVYGSQTTNVFTVLVGEGATPEVAQADWSQVQAEAQTIIASKLPPGVNAKLNTTNVADLGDRAATLTGGATLGGAPVGFTGVYVLKGATFFYLTDIVVGHSAPSASAMQAQAQTVLTRLG